VNDANFETNVNEAKLLGLPRSIVGVIAGILAFLLITVPVHLYQIQSPTKLLAIPLAGLTSPGLITYFLISFMSIALNIDFIDPSSLTFTVIFFFVYYGISSLPAALIGSFLISDKRIDRVVGFDFLVIYLLIVLGCGFIFRGFAD